MSDSNSYLDLAQRIEENFMEIESDAIVDFRENDEEYAALFQKISALKADNPVIAKIIEGEGELALSAEQHRVVSEYFSLQFKLESLERQQLYFRGHSDCMAYLKKIGVL